VFDDVLYSISATQGDPQGKIGLNLRKQHFLGEPDELAIHHTIILAHLPRKTARKDEILFSSIYYTDCTCNWTNEEQQFRRVFKLERVSLCLRVKTAFVPSYFGECEELRQALKME
jgi:hypothetical protein